MRAPTCRLRVLYASHDYPCENEIGTLPAISGACWPAMTHSNEFDDLPIILYATLLLKA